WGWSWSGSGRTWSRTRQHGPRSSVPVGRIWRPVSSRRARSSSITPSSRTPRRTRAEVPVPGSVWGGPRIRSGCGALLHARASPPAALRPAGTRSPVVDELERHVEVLALQQCDDGLQIIPALRGDPQLIALDPRLDPLGSLVADQLGDHLGVLRADALLERGHQAHLLARLLRVDHVQRLERDASTHQLGLQHVQHGEHALLRVGGHDDLIAAECERGARVPEVVALADLLHGLVDGVVDLLAIELADDVER